MLSHATPCRPVLCRAVLFLLQALLQAEWDATNAAEVMKAVADPPGEHTIAGDGVVQLGRLLGRLGIVCKLQHDIVSDSG